MAQSVRRMFLRRKTRDEARKESLRVRREMSDLKRLQGIREEIKADYTRIVDYYVPDWIVRLSLHVPPKWYIDFWRVIVYNLPPEWYTTGVHASNIPLWFKWLLIRPIVFIGQDVLGVIFVKSLLVIRRRLRVFGILVKEKVVSKDTIKLEIRYFFTKVYEHEYKLPERPKPGNGEHGLQRTVPERVKRYIKEKGGKDA